MRTGLHKRRRGDRMAHQPPAALSRDGLRKYAKTPVAPDPTRGRTLKSPRIGPWLEDTPPRLRRKRRRGLVIPGRQAKGARPGLSLRVTGGCHHPLPSPPFGPRNKHPVEVPNIAGQIDTSIWHVPPCPKSAHKENSKSLLIHSDTTFSPLRSGPKAASRHSHQKQIPAMRLVKSKCDFFCSVVVFVLVRLRGRALLFRD